MPFKMAQKILWNNQGHMKCTSNNPKMKLNLAQNQLQEAKGIELRGSIGKEDTYKDKATWLAWETKLP